ncbi:MAG: hypothetical protein V3569_02750 [Acholeplasmataceae bacterium]|nr:hypothetical protein [Acholeplasmataceae bacterium]
MKTQDFYDIAHVAHDTGRMVESYMIKYLLKEVSGEEVIKELSRFQNKDGGFGHGLEPDCWNPFSSPIQTQFAMGYLRLIEFDKNDKVIKKMMRYLEKTYDQKLRKWHLLLPSNDHYPHAPWWSYRENEEDYNPSASIAGFIIKYGKPKTKSLKYALEVAFDVMEDLMNDRISKEPHELSNLVDLFDDASDFFKTYDNFKIAKNILIDLIGEVIEKDQEKWFTSYVTKPSVLIHSKESIGYEKYKDLLHLEFKESMNHRNELRIWPVTWTWTEYLDVFEEAKEIWGSIIALKYLYLMQHDIEE